MKNWRCMIVLAAVLIDWPSAVFAGRPNVIAPSIATQIHRLESTRWKVRHSAERALLLAPTDALPAVNEAWIRTSDPELATRLQRIGLQLYLEREILDGGRRSFLGIRFMVVSIAPEKQPLSAVYVEKVLRGFPAGRRLRHGDMIIGINGHYFGPDMTAEDFVQLMTEFRAGNRVVLQVLRAGRRRIIAIRLRLIGAPTSDLSLATWLSTRAELISRYLRYLHYLKREVQGGGSIPAESPITFFHQGKGPKS